MTQSGNTVEVRDRIDWVGYVDWESRDFHGYHTARGTTYNAYLVRDEKTALIDTVKAPFADHLLRNVAGLVDSSSVDYIVCNHAEPDHAGALPEMMRAMAGATLVCDKRCAGILGQHVDTSGWKIQIVATGDTISLGRRTLRFLETPMVHWPESMFTYVSEERLLFSMDAFGQHYATSGRFDDEATLCTALEEAKIYYANIVMPTAKQVAKVLGQVASLQVDMIAPSHGVIWRSAVREIWAAYEKWSAGPAKRKVVVLYDTMWGSTAKMAHAIHQGASREGVEAVLIPIRQSDLTRIATEVFDAAAVAIGSPTLNRGMMPMVGAVLTYLRGLKPDGKVGLAFGSYGWGHGGPEGVQQGLDEMQWEVLREPIRAQYRPTPEVLEQCRQAGAALAERALQAAPDGQDRRVCVNP